MDQAQRSSYEANKREMFDGMRAYHQSEISHSNHAITMLLAIAGAAGAVVLAILFPKEAPYNIVQIAWGLFVVVAVLSLTIAWTTHLKISADHATYEAYGDQYVKTSELLGFYDEVEFGEKKVTLKTSRDIGKGKGYRKTQKIIWSFAVEITALALLFAMFSCHFVRA
jgi:hypothetical protein